MVGKCFTTELSQHFQLSFSFSIDGIKHMTKATHKIKSILGAPTQSSRKLKSMTMVGSVATGRQAGRRSWELTSAPQSQGRKMVWASEPSKPSDTSFYKGTPNPSQPASSTNFGPHIQAWASRSHPHSNLASAFSFSNSSPGQPQTLILSLSLPSAGITDVSHNTPSFFFVYFYFRFLFVF